jgi:hypothetical protein
MGNMLANEGGSRYTRPMPGIWSSPRLIASEDGKKGFGAGPSGDLDCGAMTAISPIRQSPNRQ